jgi:16S rRNA A1518/A1519 N6-dimethyltransferase RsmA/KsgA/DIM1 with predicted DNA glycosylase/AP lyase activity
MQREVADRVSAAPGVRDYGLLSATAQMNAQVDHLFTLPPSAFSPPPEVYSTVLRLEFAPRFVELSVDPSGFDTFLHQCFAQKRRPCRTIFELRDIQPTNSPRHGQPAFRHRHAQKRWHWNPWQSFTEL